MTDVIIVDDEKLNSNIFSSSIQLHTDEQYHPVQIINHPARPGNIAEGKLVAYLKEYFKEHPDKRPVVLLDIRFGHDDLTFLGREIALYLLDEKNGFRDRLGIAILTHFSDDWSLFNELYDAGAKVFARKTKVDDRLKMILDAARDNEFYLGPFDPTRRFEEIDLPPVQEGAIRYLAYGFSQKYLKKRDKQPYTAIDTQKKDFKKKYIDAVSGIRTSVTKSPNAEDWNDVWILLYFLRANDAQAIKYVEQVCNIKITVPTQFHEGN